MNGYSQSDHAMAGEPTKHETVSTVNESHLASVSCILQSFGARIQMVASAGWNLSGQAMIDFSSTNVDRR